MYTYILKCGGSFYTGFAADIEKRLRQHLGLISGGAKFTSRLCRAERLAALWQDENGEYARKLEYRIKRQLSHTQKERLCADMSLSYTDLGIELPEGGMKRLCVDGINKKFGLV